MQVKLEIPIVLRRIKINGPAGFREMDVVLDTGEVYYWEEGEKVCHEKKGTERLRLEAVE